jgi:hypothetical protein
MTAGRSARPPGPAAIPQACGRRASGFWRRRSKANGQILPRQGQIKAQNARHNPCAAVMLAATLPGLVKPACAGRIPPFYLPPAPFHGALAILADLP